jgi:putative endonuclease
MAEHNDTGNWGENQAAEYLEKKGFSIRARNFRHEHAEIDIVAEKDKTLVFVEVKTRKWASFGLPETFVNPTKVRLVKRTAEHFIFTQDWKFDVRFDIVSILIHSANNHSIHHIEDAFY